MTQYIEKIKKEDMLEEHIYTYIASDGDFEVKGRVGEYCYGVGIPKLQDTEEKRDWAIDIVFKSMWVDKKFGRHSLELAREAKFYPSDHGMPSKNIYKVIWLK